MDISDDGNRYIMIIGDYFANWVEAYAIPNQEVTTVAKVEVMELSLWSPSGKPYTVDQGRNFESVRMR